MVVWPICFIFFVAAFILHWWSLWIVFALTFIWLVLINSVWFVPTGCVGFKRVYGKQKSKSYTDGVNWMIPVISETFLLDVMLQTKDITDTKKVITRNNVDLEATLTFELEEKYAHIVFKKMGVDYYNTHVAKWVDATFDTMVSMLSYPHFQAKKADVEAWASKLVQYELAAKSSDMTKEILTECSFVTKAYALKPENVFETLVIGDDETEEVQLFDLGEVDVTLDGVNLFKNVSLKINKVKFEKAYEDARANVAVRKAEVEETKLKAEKARIAAQGMKDAAVIKAQGEAEAIKKIEGAKNIMAKRLGDYLKDNPAMLKRILFENFPKVFGGANPMLSVDDLFKEDTTAKP